MAWLVDLSEPYLQAALLTIVLIPTWWNITARYALPRLTLASSTGPSS